MRAGSGWRARSRRAKEEKWRWEIVAEKRKFQFRIPIRFHFETRCRGWLLAPLLNRELNNYTPGKVLNRMFRRLRSVSDRKYTEIRAKYPRSPAAAVQANTIQCVDLLGTNQVQQNGTDLLCLNFYGSKITQNSQAASKLNPLLSLSLSLSSESVIAARATTTTCREISKFPPSRRRCRRED